MKNLNGVRILLMLGFITGAYAQVAVPAPSAPACPIEAGSKFLQGNAGVSTSGSKSELSFTSQIKLPEKPALRPRRRLPKPTTITYNEDLHTGAVIVKFKDGSSFRLSEGTLTSSSAEESAAVARVLTGLIPARVFSRTDEHLRRDKECGELTSGRELPDLKQYFILQPSASRSPRENEATVVALNALEYVEVAYLQTRSAPLPGIDIAPPTTFNVEPTLAFLEAAPLGIDARYAWAQPGGMGEYAKILDIEWGWRLEVGR